MSGVPSTASDVDVDLGRLFAGLAARWKRVVLVALAVTALALGFAAIATPLYKAETRVLIETRESVFTRPDSNGENERPLLDEEGIASQVEVMLSTDILKTVAAKLDLARLPEFDDAADMSTLSRLLVIAGLKADPNEVPPEERVLKNFREKLSIYRVEKSRVIVIEMSSEDPKLAAEIPNALADAYISVQGEAKLLSNSEATDWLAPEIDSLSKRVKEAEQKVANFRAQSDLLIGQNNSVLATQQLSELSTELSRVRASRGAAEANAESVRAVLKSGGSLDALPDVMSSTLIQRLRERQVQLKADIADMSTTLLENHPRIRALRSQLADLDRQIRTEAENVLKGLGAEARTAQMREQQLVADLNALKAESARAGEEEVELRALEREANAQRQLLESYMARYREASSRGEGKYLPADARIFSRAVTPSEPYFPKALPIAGAAFVGSLLVMIILTLMQELFSGRAMRPAQGARPEAVEQVVMPADHVDVPERRTVAAPAVEMPEEAGETVSAEPVVVETKRPAVERARLEEAPPFDAQPPESALAEAEATAHAEPAEAMAAVAVAAEPSAHPKQVAVEPVPEPIRREPLPAMQLGKETFRDAWEKHKRLQADLSWLENPAERAPADQQPSQDDEDMKLRNPFARRPARASEPAPVAQSRSRFGEVGIEGAAERLIAGGATRAIFVSPEGDEAAASAVLVAREVSDAGLRVLLLDLTASGAATLPMLDSVAYPGITNLLASEAQFTEAIHTDHYSHCHVMPVGTADPARAMRAADRLPIIMQSLTSAYDVVVVECGPADAEGIRRLVADGTEIMVSVLEPDEQIAAAAEELKAGGYDHVMLVTPADHHSPNPPVPGRSAA
jgi:exopolysaccharide transport family protein